MRAIKLIKKNTIHETISTTPAWPCTHVVHSYLRRFVDLLVNVFGVGSRRATFVLMLVVVMRVEIEPN